MRVKYIKNIFLKNFNDSYKSTVREIFIKVSLV